MVSGRYASEQARKFNSFDYVHVSAKRKVYLWKPCPAQDATVKRRHALAVIFQRVSQNQPDIGSVIVLTLTLWPPCKFSKTEPLGSPGDSRSLLICRGRTGSGVSR